jgi:hypothetical protein
MFAPVHWLAWPAARSIEQTRPAAYTSTMMSIVSSGGGCLAASAAADRSMRGALVVHLAVYVAPCHLDVCGPLLVHTFAVCHLHPCFELVTEF